MDTVLKAKLVGFAMETMTNDRVIQSHPGRQAQPPLPAKPKVITKARVGDTALRVREGNERRMIRH